MVNMHRSRFVWTGWGGANGYTNFYGVGGQAAQAFATAAWDFMKAVAAIGVSPGTALNQNMRITQDPFVTTIDDATGDEGGLIAVTPGATIAGASTQAMAAPAGLVVNWITPNFIKGRRLRGKTYLVPLAVSCYDSVGTLADTYRSQVISNAQAFIATTTGPLVWHRPTTVGGSDGSSTLATTATVNDRVAMLTSRRS